MKLRLLFASLALLLGLAAAAKPAHPGVFTLTQPDGKTFRAQLLGDEFSKLLQLEDGCAIVKDADGFYCYAVFDSEGRRFSSGRRVGERVEASVQAASRRIPSGALRTQAARGRRNAAPGPVSVPASGMRVLVVPVQFTDVKFKYTEAHLSAMLNQEGFSFEGATGSVADYLRAQFGPETPFVFDVAPIVDLPRPEAEYGGNDSLGNDKNATLAVKEACELLEPVVDFSQYDSDGDGYVDNVFVVFAGKDEADGGDEDCIWSHQWQLSYVGYTCLVDGVYVDRYAMTAELFPTDTGWNLVTIGSFCHEFSHLLGLLDLYDTDYEKSGGRTSGVWGFTSLMDYGCYNNFGRTPPSYNAIELGVLGLGTEETLTAGFFTLDALADSQRYYRMNTEDDCIFYLLECRQTKGWDAYIGGNGLLVYRINMSEHSYGYSSEYGNITALTRWALNEINCNPDHYCAQVMVAEEPAKRIGWAAPDEISSIYYPGKTSQYTTFRTEESPLSISDITLTAKGVSFTVTGPIVMDRTDVFQDAVILNWHLEEAAPDGGAVYVSWEQGGKQQSVTCQPYQDLQYALTIEGLSAGTTYPLSVYILGYEGEKISFDALIATKPYYPGSFPAISLQGADRYLSGAFKLGTGIPLRLMNLEKVTEIRWTYDGKPVEVGPDGYFRPENSGELRAEVHYGNGAREIIIKKMEVK